MNLNKNFIIIGIVAIVTGVLVMFALRKSGIDKSAITIENVEKKPDEVFEILMDDKIVENGAESNIANKTNQQKIKPTNEGEKRVDEVKKEEMIEAFKNSKYTSCTDIILDYSERLEALRKGNMKPFAEFPISTDPTIRYCRKTNTEFRVKLDSLEDIGKKIIEVKLKEFN